MYGDLELEDKDDLREVITKTSDLTLQSAWEKEIANNTYITNYIQKARKEIAKMTKTIRDTQNNSMNIILASTSKRLLRQALAFNTYLAPIKIESDFCATVKELIEAVNQLQTPTSDKEWYQERLMIDIRRWYNFINRDTNYRIDPLGSFTHNSKLCISKK